MCQGLVPTTCGACVGVDTLDSGAWKSCESRKVWVCPSCCVALANGYPCREFNIQYCATWMSESDRAMGERLIMEAKVFQLTGSADFAHYWREDSDCWVFSTVPRGSRPVGVTEAAHWHGTCLSLARRIYEQGYIVSSSTRGGCTGWFGFEDGRGQSGRGHAMDRATLWRGWLQDPDERSRGIDGIDVKDRSGLWFTAWSSPVAVRVWLPVKLLPPRDAVGSPSIRKQVVRAKPGKIIPVQGSAFQIHVHAPTLERFRALEGKLPDLKAQTAVMCRTMLGLPDELLTGRSNVRSSCGACVELTSPDFKDWTRATDSGRYTCPSCIQAMQQQSSRIESNRS